jgi:LacI family transcriptional regulator
MEKRVTLRDIAKATGVHFTTVGLVMRNNPRVKPSTAAKVRRAARQLGYTQDAMLSALSTYRHASARKFAGTIGFIVTYPPERLKQSNFTDRIVIDAATAYAKSQGFGLEPFQINAPGMTASRMNQILRARNVQGLILATRLPEPGPMPELDWQHFSTVAIGYSITNLTLHRACPHHARNMRLLLAELRSRGYQRIGLVLQRNIYERNMGIVLGAYLAEQYLHPADKHIPPLFAEEITKPALKDWLRSQRIDCVILTDRPLEISEWINELGYRVPDQLGIALISRWGENGAIAGIDERPELFGEAAANFAVSLIQHNERGLAESPRYLLVQGRWVERPTVRALPA